MYAIKSRQIHYTMTGCACCSLQNAILLLDESTNELEMSQKWPEISLFAPHKIIKLIFLIGTLTDQVIRSYFIIIII